MYTQSQVFTFDENPYYINNTVLCNNIKFLSFILNFQIGWDTLT